jgi:threonine dehydratase
VSLSVKSGSIEELAAITSVAENRGARKTEQRQFDIVSKHVDELVVVEGDEAITSLLEVLREEKILVEPASSCSLAALSSGKIQIDLGQRIAVIMCGGNVALERVCQWMQII